MNIVVEYTAQLRDRTGCESEPFDVSDDATLADVLKAVVDRHGADVAGLLLDEDAAPSASLLCFIAEEQVVGSATLSDGDVVTLMTPISGG
jgi:molybdopterin converting factor small subunit